MTEKHPTYPNPVIQEALCEIHFLLREDERWKASFFGDFYKAIQEDFPEMEPGMHIGIKLQVGSSEIAQALTSPQQMMRFTHVSQRLILQLFPNMLTINELPKYPGWENMSKNILSAWAKLKNIINPMGVKRIGLRYINRIDRVKQDEKPGEWLRSTDFLPGAVLDSQPGLLSRVITKKTSQEEIIVTLAEKENGNVPKNGAIVFDIDCKIQKQIDIDDAALTEQINKLHDCAWNIFSASMTPMLEKLLKGELK